MANAYHYSNTFDDTLAARFKGILSMGFDPRQLEDLKFWLDAKHTSSIIKDINNKINRWLDRSGFNAHMVQDTMTKQPLYIANAINSKPGIRFDGVDDAMVATITSLGALTVMMVASSNANPAPISNVQAFLATAPAGASIQGWSITGKSVISQTERRLRSEGNFSSQHYKNGIAGTAGSNPGTATDLELSVPFISASEFSGGTAKTELHLAELQSGSHRGMHDFGEILIFGRILPASQRKILESYLSAKWAISLQ